MLLVSSCIHSEVRVDDGSEFHYQATPVDAGGRLAAAFLVVSATVESNTSVPNACCAFMFGYARTNR